MPIASPRTPAKRRAAVVAAAPAAVTLEASPAPEVVPGPRPVSLSPRKRRPRFVF